MHVETLKWFHDWKMRLAMAAVITSMSLEKY